MIGQEDTGMLSTNHVRGFRHSFSKVETGFKCVSGRKVRSNLRCKGKEGRYLPAARFRG
jgi:hypothetical protein